jgi:hypothetical protein
MIDEHVVILCTLLASGLPLSYAIAKSWRQLGTSFFLLSPLPIFTFAYVCAFVLKPFVETLLPFRYPFTIDFEYSVFISAQVYSILSVNAFVVSYSSFFNAPLPLKTLERPPTVVGRPYRVYQVVAGSISLLFSLIFFVILLNLGVITLNFGENRVSFLNQMHGTGYVFLINNAAFVFFVISAVQSLWTNRRSIVAILSLLVLVLSNTFVSNRSFVTIVLFTCVLLFIVHRYRRGLEVSAAKLLTLLLVLVVLGAGIGLMRGTQGFGNQDFLPYVFLLLTFDMSETFQTVLSRHESFDWGLSWVEDVVFTYLPRLVFEDKPNVYGAMRLQVEYMPESSPAAEIFNATYPLGIFGESYANFGLLGILSSLFILGAALKFLYYRTLAGLLTFKPKFFAAGTLLLYSILCANSLGYIRSFGWFLAGIVFLLSLFFMCYLVTIGVSSLILGRGGRITQILQSR